MPPSTDRKVETYAKDEAIEAEIASKLIADETAKFLDVSSYCYTGMYTWSVSMEEKQKERPFLLPGSEWCGIRNALYASQAGGEGLGSTDNMAITSEVKSKLIEDKDIWSTNVDVKTVQCNVVLLGVVGSQKEIDKAVAHTRV